MRNEYTREGCPTFRGRGGGGFFMGLGLALIAYGCVHMYLTIGSSYFVAFVGSFLPFILGAFFLIEGLRKWNQRKL